MILNRTSPTPPPSTDTDDSDWVVAVDGVRQRLNDRLVLKDVDLHAAEGELYGLLGPNGAGKTTTLWTLLGLLEPVAGTVQLREKPPSQAPRTRANVGIAFEYETLNPKWTVADNLRHTCAIYPEADPSRIDEMLSTVDLDPAERDTNFGALSKGMKRKVSLANALLPDPSVLVLDEPTSGLDPTARQTVQNVLADLAAAERTIILSSHDLAEVESLCDRVGIIRDGRTVLETTLDAPLYVFEEEPDEMLVRSAGAVAVTTAPAASNRPDAEMVDLETLYFSVLGMDDR